MDIDTYTAGSVARRKAVAVLFPGCRILRLRMHVIVVRSRVPKVGTLVGAVGCGLAAALGLWTAYGTFLDGMTAPPPNRSGSDVGA